MSDLAILQELGLPLFVPREAEAPRLPFVISLHEKKTEFSQAHHTQLTKIIDFLGFKPEEYQLYHSDQALEQGIILLLSFGSTSLQAERCITTHSISTMLQNPESKREVLHAIQSLRRQS